MFFFFLCFILPPCSDQSIMNFHSERFSVLHANASGIASAALGPTPGQMAPGMFGPGFDRLIS